MASNFAHLLKRTSGTAKKPPELPAGDFPGIISQFEVGDANKNKTPYVRFQLKLTGWGDNEPLEGVDLSKRQFRKDFYLTEEAAWRLDDFYKSMGMETGRPDEEMFQELVGQQVTVEIQQYLNKESNEIGNQVGKLLPAS